MKNRGVACLLLSTFDKLRAQDQKERTGRADLFRRSLSPLQILDEGVAEGARASELAGLLGLG